MSKVIIFTDGACSGNPGPGGYAAILNHETDYTLVKGSSKHTTNNAMELRAVTLALKKAIQLGYDEVVINTDSAYVVNAVTKKWIVRWRMNGWKNNAGELISNSSDWQLLYDLLTTEGVTTTFIKIKGHSGNVFNELADSVACQMRDKAKGAAK